MGDDLLKAQEISKSFCLPNGRSFTVLDKLSFEVSKREMLAVMGPSGSGKSTFLHILAGIEKPTRGDVVYKGMSFKEASDKQMSLVRRKEFGFIFQFYHLLPELDVFDNIAISLRLNRWEKNRLVGRVNDLLKEIGLADRAHQPVNTLSGGEMQRVAVARAVAHMPKILFADEPTGSLDSANSAEVISLLKRLAAQNNTTVVIVTHSLEVAKIFGKILYLKDGRLIKEER